MSDIHQGSGTGIVMAAVVGAAVGAGVALLLAPCSGKETRAWLARRTQDLKDKTTSALEQGKEATLRAAKAIGREVEDAAHPPERPVYTESGGTRLRS